MFTPLMESGFVQWINIYNLDEKQSIRFMMASQDVVGYITTVDGIS